MKQFIPVLATTLLLTLSVAARSWTSTQGKNVDAEVVKVNPDRTAVLKTSRGKIVTVPFDTFVEEDVEHLDYLLSRRGRGKLHAVPWQELNELFGRDIWKDDLLWDDPTAEVAERMGLNKESKTDFMENHRAYPLGKENVLSEPVYAIALYGGKEKSENLSFIFLNRGDIPPIIGSGRIVIEQIEACGIRVHDALFPVLGKPKRDTLGKGEMREKVWRWDWNSHAIMLSLQEGKYSALRIMPSDRADRAGRVEKITENGLKKRMASCVERRENGDVIIRNIPMVDQGPKGYCSPATWERYLRYMEIPADMYLLALAANTGAGGGTQPRAIISATRFLISANGRELEYIGSSVYPDAVSEYIDQGLPIMWRLLSTPGFQRKANNNTARRNGEEQKEKPAGQNEDTISGGHICLIIGYNERTGEIAISDSWGPTFAERWIPAHDAQNVSNGGMNVIKW